MSLFGRKEKVKPEIKRIEISEHGEPKYCFTHIFTLDEYREYNDTVSAPAVERDKKLKKWGAIIMGVIAAAFLVMSIQHFDLMDYLKDGRTFWQWLNFTGFNFYFLVFIMSGYLTYHLGTYYKHFPKRLEKATREYYNSSKYLTNELTLAVYEDGVLEKASVRDEFFTWDMFNRCWESENIVYLEFTLANQLFVAKHTIADAGVDKEEFMTFCNEHIEEGKRLAAQKEAAEEEAEEAEEREFEENQKKIAELEAKNEDQNEDI